MDEEKRMIENYEVRHSVFLGDREIVFAIDKDAPMPYLVSDCTDWGGFGLLRYDNAIAGDDYLEQMQEFTKRIDPADSAGAGRADAAWYRSRAPDRGALHGQWHE